MESLVVQPPEQEKPVKVMGAPLHSSPPLAVIHLLMVVAAILVSTSFLVGAAITRALDPALLTLFRFLLAALLFAPWVGWRHGLAASWSFIGRCTLISACLVTFFWCMFLALRYTTALNTSVIFALVPSISGLYAMILNRERLGGPQLIALACGVLGVFLVIFSGDLSRLLALDWNRGDLIFFLGCLAMGLYTPLVRRLHQGESMLLMTFWVLVTGSLWLMLISFPQLLRFDFASVASSTWLGIAYLAVFTTIVTFFLTQYSVPFLGPTRVMAYSYLYPGLVLLLNLALGHGLPPVGVLPGVLIIVSAMFVLQAGAGKKAGA